VYRERDSAVRLPGSTKPLAACATVRNSTGGRHSERARSLYIRLRIFAETRVVHDAHSQKLCTTAVVVATKSSFAFNTAENCANAKQVRKLLLRDFFRARPLNGNF